MLKKITALMLALVSLSLASCVPVIPDIIAPEPAEEVFVPPLGENTKETVSFESIAYSRPDTDKIISEAKSITASLNKSSLSYEEICDKILSLNEDYKSFSTMLTYAMIKNSKDSSDKAMAAEYEHLKEASPTLTRAFEELFEAAAKSPYAKKLEEELFWDGFVEEYADGTMYNDIVVSLLESEAEIEAEYASLSTANVIITYGRSTDTYDNIVSDLKDKYNPDSPILKKAIKDCDSLYAKAVQKESSKAFIDLLKVRRRLADALGYGSYSEYAYEILGHGYTEGDLDALISDISRYVTPVYASLVSNAFAGYFKTHLSPAPDRGKVINRVYTALEKIDSDAAAAYAYMLNCGLYEVDEQKTNRLGGAFTTYLYDIESPFVFVTLSGGVNDYMTLSHEFGHFYDAYVNYNVDASLDLLEVSSTALELLVLSAIGDSISEREYKYLYYSEMQSMLEALIFQGFYAKFESLAYSLSFEEITEERLNTLVAAAAESMNLNPRHFKSLEDIMIYHLVMEPFYVQSYCTSVTVSLDIFFTECKNKGAGSDAYMALIDRNEGSDFIKELTRVSLPSPFRENALRDLADEIYYSVMGSYYFVDGSNNNAA